LLTRYNLRASDPEKIAGADIHEFRPRYQYSGYGLPSVLLLATL
jgi:hypothetical protein